MSRKCKCFVTGETGTTDTFVKIGNHYYKNEYVYKEDRRIKEERKKLLDYICKKFLQYNEGQPFPPLLPKKIKELSYYDDAVIYETFLLCENDILYWLEHKNFDSDYGKIAYIFAIINNKIPDVNKDYIHKEKIRVQENNKIAYSSDPELSTGTNKTGKNISEFLEDDDL